MLLGWALKEQKEVTLEYIIWERLGARPSMKRSFTPSNNFVTSHHFKKRIRTGFGNQSPYSLSPHSQHSLTTSSLSKLSLSANCRSFFESFHVEPIKTLSILSLSKLLFFLSFHVEPVEAAQTPFPRSQQIEEIYCWTDLQKTQESNPSRSCPKYSKPLSMISSIEKKK